jgi:hypothetical protein
MGARSRSSSNLSVGINNIFSVDPLRVTLDENETPREPRFEECEVLVRKLFETHKQQKQQVRLNVSVGRGRGHLCHRVQTVVFLLKISNMKAVLKDMLHTENLSNQGMMMTRDVLENSSRMNKYPNEINPLSPK